jgi:8-oxo-dGTP diphosphatase
MDKPILVTCAIIRKEGKYLIAQRKHDSLLEPDKWEFPGGKVDFGESPEDCIVREIKEEHDITIKVDHLLGINSNLYQKEGKTYHVILVAYLAEYVQGKLKNLACQDSKWITKDQFKDFPLIPADAEFAGLLR